MKVVKAVLGIAYAFALAVVAGLPLRVVSAILRILKDAIEGIADLTDGARLQLHRHGIRVIESVVKGVQND